MVYRRVQVFIGLHKGIRWAFNRSLMPEPSHYTAAQSGFPHAQIAIQEHHNALIGCLHQPGKLTAQALCFRFTLQKQPAFIAENAHNASWSSPLFTFSASHSTFGKALITSVGVSPI